MKSVQCFLFTLICLVVLAVPLHADDLTLFGGIQDPGSLTLQSATNALVSVKPATFGTFGLRYARGRVIGTEMTLAYSPNFLSSQHYAFIFNGNLILQAPLPIVRPYLTGGLGTVYVRGSGLQAVTGGKFALNYGGGLKIKLVGPLGVQLDSRGYSVFSVNSATLHVLEASVGVVFSF
jgi:hypothetical protein